MLLACGGEPPAVDKAPPAVLLARHPELRSSLSLPPSSRPEGAPTPAEVAVAGPYRELARDKGGVLYTADLPIRGIYRGHHAHGKPDEVDLLPPISHRMRWVASAPDDPGPTWTWEIDGDQLRLRLPADQPAPDPGAWRLSAPGCAKAEDALNLGSSGLSPEAFLTHTILLDEDSATGLLLPAPAEVSYELNLPAGGLLETTVRLLLPFVDEGLQTDGARLHIELDRGGEREVLLDEHIASGSVTPLRLPTGEPGPARLTIRTEPGESPRLDYVFLEEPALFVPSLHPRRLLVVLVDTLRADHLGVYGYKRDTSPRIDAWAAGAAALRAWAPAPWTLPSMRSALSGRQPEAWASGEHLGSALARAGYSSALLTANAYLSRHFGMSEGWSWHSYELLASAPAQVARARALAAAHPDRDLALVVHLMDTHMPHQEAEELRHLWAGPTPKGLSDTLTAASLRKLDDKGRLSAADKDWVRDRYDQNIRQVDRAMGALLDLVGPEATVALVSDHGEELWDHGGFEHGHALWEELVHIPFLIAGPGIAASRPQDPVSLMDLAPTLLHQLGLPADPSASGLDLSPLLAGTPMPALLARPLAYGRLLYGHSAWGVLVEGHQKWVGELGLERVVDLNLDPDERAPAIGAAPRFDAALGAGLDQEIVRGWRVALPGAGEPSGTLQSTWPSAVVRLLSPRGIAAAWTAPDPLGRNGGRISPFEGPTGTGVELRALKGSRLSAELLVEPGGDPTDLDGVILEAQVGRAQASASTGEPDGPAEHLRSVHLHNGEVVLTPAVFPRPSLEPTDTIEAGVQQALEELGYIGE